MEKKSLAVSKAYQLLEPGPVVMVTTAHGDKMNVMTMTWQTMIDFVPPLFACVIDANNYSFELLKKSKECVINIPSVDLIKQVVGVGNTTGAKINKFEKFNLTPAAASLVKAPMVDECYANLECRVFDMHLVAKYNIFILEIVKAWVITSKKRQLMFHHQGNGVFAVDGKLVKIPSKKK